MSTLTIALIAFGFIFGGMLVGMFLRAVLPEHHLSDESKDAVKLGVGMIATLAALVLGLLIASAKSNFDTMKSGLVQTGSKIILLDRIMDQYGPETKEARELLRRSVATAIDLIWPKGRAVHGDGKSMNPREGLESIQEKLLRLSPSNESQRWLLSQALQISSSMAEVRWLLTEQREQSSLPMTKKGMGSELCSRCSVSSGNKAHYPCPSLSCWYSGLSSSFSLSAWSHPRMAPSLPSCVSVLCRQQELSI